MTIEVLEEEEVKWTCRVNPKCPKVSNSLAAINEVIKTFNCCCEFYGLPRHTGYIDPVAQLLCAEGPPSIVVEVIDTVGVRIKPNGSQSITEVAHDRNGMTIRFRNGTSITIHFMTLIFQG